MRGTYEAFILVKIKDGREYVCALNRQRTTKKSSNVPDIRHTKDYLDNQVIWN